MLTNPYMPPVSRDRHGLPAIRTRGSRGPYRQLGILTDGDGRKILPLMGRERDSARSKWNYYTMTDNHVKLPVSVKRRSCTAETGCDELHNGDTAYVEGYGHVFKATIYENDAFEYSPSL